MLDVGSTPVRWVGGSGFCELGAGGWGQEEG